MTPNFEIKHLEEAEGIRKALRNLFKRKKSGVLEYINHSPQRRTRCNYDLSSLSEFDICFENIINDLKGGFLPIRVRMAYRLK